MEWATWITARQDELQLNDLTLLWEINLLLAALNKHSKLFAALNKIQGPDENYSTQGIPSLQKAFTVLKKNKKKNLFLLPLVSCFQ